MNLEAQWGKIADVGLDVKIARRMKIPPGRGDTSSEPIRGRDSGTQAPANSRVEASHLHAGACVVSLSDS